MRNYDSNLPLIAIHIPKTAGVSFREVLMEWFGSKLLLHYYSEATGEMPPKYDLTSLHSKEGPVVVYGHFNRKRNFGVEHYYPEVKQFITILRDPFEMCVSGYFFMRERGVAWKDQSRIPKRELYDHILKSEGYLENFFPRKVTLVNYKEIIETQFIEIGITEHMDESVKRIANKLNRKYTPGSLHQLNVTARDQRVPYELKDEFIERHPLDYAIYNHVLSSYV